MTMMITMMLMMIILNNMIIITNGARSSRSGAAFSSFVASAGDPGLSSWLSSSLSFISSSTGDPQFSLLWPSSSTKLSYYSSFYQSSSSSPPALLPFQHLPPQPTWCSPSYIHLHKVCRSCSLLWHVSTKGGKFLYIGFIFMVNLTFVRVDWQSGQLRGFSRVGEQ